MSMKAPAAAPIGIAAGAFSQETGPEEGEKMDTALWVILVMAMMTGGA